MRRMTIGGRSCSGRRSRLVQRMERACLWSLLETLQSWRTGVSRATMVVRKCSSMERIVIEETSRGELKIATGVPSCEGSGIPDCLARRKLKSII